MNKRIPGAAAGALVLGTVLGLGAGTASAAGTAGTLDGTFGHGGIVLTNLGLDANGNQIQGNPSAAALQSNGDIVVAVGLSGPGAGLGQGARHRPRRKTHRRRRPRRRPRPRPDALSAPGATRRRGGDAAHGWPDIARH